MKYILSLSIFFISIIIWNLNKDINNTIEVTLTIPQLNSIELTQRLENEFKKHKEIDFINGSIMTKTLVIRVNENSFNKGDIESLLYKWGCNVSDYYYRKLYKVENI